MKQDGLRGRVFLITGSGRGLGAALARAAVQEGANVVVSCRHMRERHWGRIVNLGAVGAATALGEPQMAVYSAAKAAVVAFSKALALEEARVGITVNVVSPGMILEDGGAKAAEAGKARLGDRVPVGHAGRAADVVRAVLLRLPGRRLRHRPGAGGRRRSARLAGC